MPPLQMRAGSSRTFTPSWDRHKVETRLSAPPKRQAESGMHLVQVLGPQVQALGIVAQDALEDGAAPLGAPCPELRQPRLRDHLRRSRGPQKSEIRSQFLRPERSRSCGCPCVTPITLCILRPPAAERTTDQVEARSQITTVSQIAESVPPQPHLNVLAGRQRGKRAIQDLLRRAAAGCAAAGVAQLQAVRPQPHLQHETRLCLGSWSGLRPLAGCTVPTAAAVLRAEMPAPTRFIGKSVEPHVREGAETLLPMSSACMRTSTRLAGQSKQEDAANTEGERCPDLHPALTSLAMGSIS